MITTPPEWAESTDAVKDIRKLKKEMKIKTEKAKNKQGMKYFIDNQDNIDVMTRDVDLEGTKLTIAVEYMTDGKHKFAYTVCSPRDTFSHRVAKRLLGWRLHEAVNREFFFFSNIDLRGLTKDELLEFAYTEIMNAAISTAFRSKIPQRLERAFRKRIKNYEEAGTEYWD